MSQKERNRRYKKKMWRYWRSQGNCGRCGILTNINKVTGRSYAECFKHRLQTAKRKRREMRKKRGYGVMAAAADLKSVGRNTVSVRI